MRPAFLAATAAAVSLFPATAAAGTGPQVWSQAGCGGCHTLQAAGASGNGGPDLDALHPSSSAVAAQVTYGGGGMPSFGGSLSASDIQALAAWVSSVAGGTATGTGTAAAPSMAVPKVKRLQRDLAKLGFFHHVVTGFYGPVTTKAVKAFQRSVGLRPDGIWGPKSQAALRARL
jgi:mono/diheme cytochrome c family protein